MNTEFPVANNEPARPRRHTLRGMKDPSNEIPSHFQWRFRIEAAPAQSGSQAAKSATGGAQSNSGGRCSGGGVMTSGNSGRKSASVETSSGGGGLNFVVKFRNPALADYNPAAA